MSVRCLPCTKSTGLIDGVITGLAIESHVTRVPLQSIYLLKNSRVFIYITDGSEWRWLRHSRGPTECCSTSGTPGRHSVCDGGDTCGLPVRSCRDAWRWTAGYRAANHRVGCCWIEGYPPSFGMVLRQKLLAGSLAFRPFTKSVTFAKSANGRSPEHHLGAPELTHQCL